MLQTLVLGNSVAVRTVICRYNPDNGELTLISERYPEREENRMHIMDMLNALIAEGERVHPSDKAAEDGQTQQQQAAHAGAE